MAAGRARPAPRALLRWMSSCNPCWTPSLCPTCSPGALAWPAAESVVWPESRLAWLPHCCLAQVWKKRARCHVPLLNTLCCAALCRVGGLDAELDWAHMLSLGEQQRVSMARLLHHKPAVAFLDEATSGEGRWRAGRQAPLLPQAAAAAAPMRHHRRRTRPSAAAVAAASPLLSPSPPELAPLPPSSPSCLHLPGAALDVATERALYTRLQQHCACFISIAHRKQLAAFHTHVLEAAGEGRWVLQDAAAFLQQLRE